MKISIPEISLVVLIGPSGSGKSSFAKKHFKPTEVLSSDYCRGLVADDENDQSATKDAFEVLHYIAGKRLGAGRLTVVDATNVQREARNPLVAMAKKHNCLPVAIVLNVSEEVCKERNLNRSDRNFGPHVIRQQIGQLKRSIKSLKREGFRNIAVLSSPEEIENIEIERARLWNNLKHEEGPFDIIGDVHGCYDELIELLEKLGYQLNGNQSRPKATHPQGRKVVFLGDLVDRGPNSPAVLRLAMSMVEDGTAFCVPGNHDVKLMRKLQGRDVRITHGLAETLEQFENESDEFKTQTVEFIHKQISHYVLDGGKLVVSHAGLSQELQGRASAKVREFCLYGDTTGEVDEFGLPIRNNWAAEYRGKSMVVYGHTPTPEADWLNRTICIDTGCVFGGKLTALRYPEREVAEVKAHKTYYEPVKPFLPDAALSSAEANREYNDLLDIDDVQGKRIIQTRIRHTVTIREENSRAALEVMSRHAVDPRWLIYLPPTMSPCETRKEGPYLEHPAEAFAYYRNQGVPKVICEEKHMGSRAAIVLCKDEAAASKRFGIKDDGFGKIYTRTGRPFINTKQETALLKRLREAVGKAGFWDEFNTDWICLDSEIMPWSAKARELLRTQYAPVGSSSKTGLAAATLALSQAEERAGKVGQLLSDFKNRHEAATKYVEAYRQYCWQVSGIEDYKIAPFHILATEGNVHTNQNHVWHMERAAELSNADPNFITATPFRVVDSTDQESVEKGVNWWEELTAKGGEGMVIKPLEWIVRGKRGLVQPAVKCRGLEYLRIIYGPEYALPKNIERLRSRALGAKRSLALREFALGLEALHRFVEKEPLYRVHECVFGVLAMESEPVDPRL